MNVSKSIRSVVACGTLAIASSSAYAVSFGVWLDGVTSIPSGDGILNSLDHAFGAGHWTLLSSAALEGSLASYDTIIMSRSGSAFGGTSITAAATANIGSYVGSGPTQGGVALFTNDAKDNFFGSTVGDPFDANLDRLFVNAATFASATHHGFIGEFNGTVIALNTLHLLAGTAGSLGAASGVFHYDVGPIGAGHAIDTGITFPFTDSDGSPFLTKVTGASASNIVDIYHLGGTGEEGLPAVMANAALIDFPPSSTPDAGSTIGMLGAAMLALVGYRNRTRK